MSDQNITLDALGTWRSDSLRSFLSRRGLSTDGNKAELIALCFAAAKMEIKVVPSESEYLRQNEIDYRKLLHIDRTEVPDPLLLSDGWANEKEGIMFWPPVFLSDIAKFFMCSCSVDNAQLYLNDYKLGKAYTYFTSEWLKEVFHHHISKDSPYCFLRCKCTPSQRIRDDDHTVWACIVKESGEIKSAYCSCTAGLGQTCNHVAGLLFRLESANKLGVSSCTSLPCTWNVPTSKTEVQPRPIADIMIKKARHGKDRVRPLVSQEKNTYKPLTDDIKIDKERLFSDLKSCIPNAVLFKALAIEEPISEVQPVKSTKAVTFTHLSMDKIAASLGSSVSEDKFIEKQPVLTQTEINSLADGTVGQASNPLWWDIRRGRITASKFYSVSTRTDSFHKNPSTDMTNIVSTVMGYKSPNPNLKPLKMGRECEPLAKTLYKQEYGKIHKNAEFRECGIFLGSKKSYLGASPDMLVSCSCCGNGLLEVKTVLVQKCEKCDKFCDCNLPKFLVHNDGIIKVKQNHEYFCQTQGQMALTGRNWCDIFVYSCNGCFQERIHFNKEYFDKIAVNLTFFFHNFIAHEILYRDVQKKVSVNSCTAEPMEVDNTHGRVHFCILCYCQILEQENIKSFRERSICCDICNRWYHFKCVGITKAVLEKTDKWSCPKCQSTV